MPQILEERIHRQQASVTSQSGANRHLPGRGFGGRREAWLPHCPHHIHFCGHIISISSLSRAQSRTPAVRLQHPSLLLLSSFLLREMSGCEACERLVENREGEGRHYNCHLDIIRQFTE